MIQQFLFLVYNQKNSKQGLKKYMYTHVPCSIIHHSQKVKETMYINR